MGFFTMIISALLGIICIVSGIHNRKKKNLNIFLISLGFILVIFAIYLGLPK